MISPDLLTKASILCAGHAADNNTHVQRLKNLIFRYTCLCHLHKLASSGTQPAATAAVVPLTLKLGGSSHELDMMLQELRIPAVITHIIMDYTALKQSSHIVVDQDKPLWSHDQVDIAGICAVADQCDPHIDHLYVTDRTHVVTAVDVDRMKGTARTVHHYRHQDENMKCYMVRVDQSNNILYVFSLLDEKTANYPTHLSTFNLAGHQFQGSHRIKAHYPITSCEYYKGRLFVSPTGPYNFSVTARQALFQTGISYLSTSQLDQAPVEIAMDLKKPLHIHRHVASVTYTIDPFTMHGKELLFRFHALGRPTVLLSYDVEASQLTQLNISKMQDSVHNAKPLYVPLMDSLWLVTDIHSHPFQIPSAQQIVSCGIGIDPPSTYDLPPEKIYESRQHTFQIKDMIVAPAGDYCYAAIQASQAANKDRYNARILVVVAC